MSFRVSRVTCTMRCPRKKDFLSATSNACWPSTANIRWWTLCHKLWHKAQRGGAEQKIRQYLVDNNHVETVISLAPNLFYGTTIAVTILVLSKHKADTTTQFIDASGLFKKETNNNTLLDEHIEQIMAVFDSKASVDHFARSVSHADIAANDYNLSVSSYVQAKDTREVLDIAQINAQLKTTVAKIDQLRKDIDAIVAEIEGGEA